MTNLRVAITAGASGIGRAFAEAYLAEGARVYVCDVDELALADFLKCSPAAVAVRADVGAPEDVNAFFDSIETRESGLDIMINNAGISGPTGPLENLEIGDWQETVNIDLNSLFYCSRRAIPLIRKAGGGSIINIASNAAFHGFPLRSPYTACKWAVVGLTKTMAMELGPDKIRVNALCPCSVEGERIDRVIRKDAKERGLKPEAVREEYERQSSLRSFVSKEDVVAMALFLTSNAGARISGQAIGIDGHTESLSLAMGKSCNESSMV